MSLKAIEIDALKEVASIGACHAATSLSQLINRRVMVKVPSLKICKIEEISDLFGSTEEEVAGILVGFSGGLRGNALLVFPLDSSMKLVDLLLNRKSRESKEFNVMEESSLKELGNILVCSYLSTLGDFLGLKVFPSVPTLVVDMIRALVVSSYLETMEEVEEVILVKTEFIFIEEGSSFVGFFVLTPCQESVRLILSAMKIV